ncbi:hypothetical protein K32_48680 [Kaistia sp. 32K]|uniref:hypothetical protein n=1 Tax=Kaistia sp. 32K TaxID=2795690 RepID=UPI001916AD03|nr:hypothetical protein [Kaistia sp. 32K]BCP56251.1 hypothetical protein K32_48680 [Kaistia sp. 32K]
MNNHRPPARMPADPSLDKHRNPNGTYNGVPALAELTGQSLDEIVALWESVKANRAKLDACPWHEFEQLITAPPGAGKYRCRHCDGEVDASAYRWHQLGRWAMPLGEPQPVAYSFTPVPGATCSRELAAAGQAYPRTCQVHGLRCGVKS